MLDERHPAIERYVQMTRASAGHAKAV